MLACRMPADRRPPLRLAAWLQLCRVSNLPTVWTDVLAGLALAGADPFARPLDLALLLASLSLFYVGGMALNDIVDADRDAAERPHRPLPAGAITPCNAKRFTTVALALALGLLLPFGESATCYGLYLLLAILLYNLLHQRFRAAALLMGLCRGLIYPLAAAALGVLHEPLVFWAAAGLTLYIVLLTVAAADEAADTPRPTRLAVLGLAPVLAVAVVPIATLVEPPPAWLPLAAGALLLLALARTAQLALGPRPRMFAAVMLGLAAICLVDALWLALLGHTLAAGVAVALFGLVRWQHRRIPGT